MKIANNIKSIPEDTRELVIEMYMSITDERYPSYNAAMLLYRPILVHILKDAGHERYWEYDYSKIINIICSEHSIPEHYKEKMFAMKSFVNKINHNCAVVLDDDRKLVEDSWEIIRELVEEIY